MEPRPAATLAPCAPRANSRQFVGEHRRVQFERFAIQVDVGPRVGRPISSPRRSVGAPADQVVDEARPRTAEWLWGSRAGGRHHVFWIDAGQNGARRKPAASPSSRAPPGAMHTTNGLAASGWAVPTPVQRLGSTRSSHGSIQSASRRHRRQRVAHRRVYASCYTLSRIIQLVLEATMARILLAEDDDSLRGFIAQGA